MAGRPRGRLKGLRCRARSRKLICSATQFLHSYCKQRFRRRPFASFDRTTATFAVGTRVTSRPPHRSVRAQFGHTAPTSGM